MISIPGFDKIAGSNFEHCEAVARRAEHMDVRSNPGLSPLFFKTLPSLINPSSFCFGVVWGHLIPASKKPLNARIPNQ